MLWWKPFQRKEAKRQSSEARRQRHRSHRSLENPGSGQTLLMQVYFVMILKMMIMMMMLKMMLKSPKSWKPRKWADFADAGLTCHDVASNNALMNVAYGDVFIGNLWNNIRAFWIVMPLLRMAEKTKNELSIARSNMFWIHLGCQSFVLMQLMVVEGKTWFDRLK